MSVSSRVLALMLASLIPVAGAAPGGFSSGTAGSTAGSVSGTGSAGAGAGAGAGVVPGGASATSAAATSSSSASSGSMSGLTTALGGTTAALNNLATATNGVSAQIPSVVTAINQMSTSANAVAGSIQAAASTAQGISEDWLGAASGFVELGQGFLTTAQDYESLIKDLSSQWGGRVDAFNQSFQTLANGLSALSDPKQMGLVAAVTGFAGTLASSIAGALPSVLWSGFEAVKEAITHEKRDRLSYETALKVESQYPTLQGRMNHFRSVMSQSVRLLRASRRVQGAAGRIAGTGEGAEIEARSRRLRMQRDRASRAYDLALSQGRDDQADACLRERDRASEELQLIQSVQTAVSQFAALSPDDLARQTCQQLKGVWEDLYLSMNEMQRLRSLMLRSEEGFLPEFIRRETRRLGRDFKTSREWLSKQAEQEARTTFLNGYTGRLLSDLRDFGLRDLRDASQMTEADLQRRYEECIRRGSSPQQASACWQEVNALLGRGAYADEKRERWESWGRFSATAMSEMQRQYELASSIRVEDATLQSAVLAHLRKFSNMAVDQAASKELYKAVVADEREFAALCQEAVPGFEYRPLGVTN